VTRERVAFAIPENRDILRYLGSPERLQGPWGGMDLRGLTMTRRGFVTDALIAALDSRRR
jgi:hypothetical protein